MGKKGKRVFSPPDKASGLDGPPDTPQRGNLASRGVRPLVFDNDKFDNPKTTITLVFAGEQPLTMAFPPYVLDEHTYQAGTDSLPLHAAIKRAIYEIMHNGLSNVCDLTQNDEENLHDIVDGHYHPSRTGDDVFSFSVLDKGTSLLTFVAATKYLTHHRKKSHIAVLVPTVVKEYVWETTASFLLDRPADDVVATHLGALSPTLNTAFRQYKEMSAIPNSPIRRITRFSETAFMDLYGNMSSSILSWTAVEGPSKAPEDTSGPTSGPKSSSPTNESADPTDNPTQDSKSSLDQKPPDKPSGSGDTDETPADASAKPPDFDSSHEQNPPDASSSKTQPRSNITRDTPKDSTKVKKPKDAPASTPKTPETMPPTDTSNVSDSTVDPMSTPASKSSRASSRQSRAKNTYRDALANKLDPPDVADGSSVPDKSNPGSSSNPWANINPESSTNPKSDASHKSPEEAAHDHATELGSLAEWSKSNEDPSLHFSDQTTANTQDLHDLSTIMAEQNTTSISGLSTIPEGSTESSGRKSSSDSSGRQSTSPSDIRQRRLHGSPDSAGTFMSAHSHTPPPSPAPLPPTPPPDPTLQQRLHDIVSDVYHRVNEVLHNATTPVAGQKNPSTPSSHASTPPHTTTGAPTPPPPPPPGNSNQSAFSTPTFRNPRQPPAVAPAPAPHGHVPPALGLHTSAAASGAPGAPSGGSGPPAPSGPPPPAPRPPPPPGPLPPPGGGPPSGGPQSRHRNYLEGVDWREHRINPHKIDEMMISRQRDYPSILPWLFPRPETGSQLNFPVCHPLTLYEKREYLNSIQTVRLGEVQYPVKSFIQGFPRLPKQATKSQLCAYLGRIVSHALGYNTYVPLFHCMVYDHASGIWYRDLPQHCIDKWRFYDECLRQALSSSYAALADSDLTKHLITQSSGYQILWRLAAIAGHPALHSGTSNVSMPRQSSKQSFHDYMEKWQHFLQIQFVQGINYNERYFIEQFFDRSHSTFNSTLKPLFLSLIRDVPLDYPLPVHFTPDRLLDYIQEKGYHIGLTTITLESIPDDFRSQGSSRRRSSDRSSDPSSSSKDVRQILDESSHSDIQPAFVDVREIQDLPDDIFLQICSLVAASALTKTCDLCGGHDHLLATCKILHKIIEDPVKTRRLLTKLEQTLKNRGGYTTRNPRDSQTRRPHDKNLRSLTNEDTDDETDQHGLTDDEADDASAGSHFS